MQKLVRLRMLPVLAALAIFAAACGGTDEGTAGETTGGSAATATVEVEMRNFKFEPAEITVAPGTEVRFVNKDSSRHNVVAGTPTNIPDDPLFSSPEMAPGNSWSYVFEEEGEYPYICTYAGHHMMGMAGVVKVSADAE